MRPLISVAQREWLASHNLIDTRTPMETSRDEYLDLMRTYYYNTSQRVWDTWSDSDMKAWLVANGVIKSDAEIKKEKMQKLIAYVLCFSSIKIFLSYESIQ